MRIDGIRRGRDDEGVDVVGQTFTMDPPAEIGPVPPGHFPVGNHELGANLLDLQDRLLHAGGLHHFVVGLCQPTARGLQIRRIIVDHQHALVVRRHRVAPLLFQTPS